MAVLITGSAGLVGHAVRRRLERDGGTVIPVDLRPVSADGVEQVACDLLDPDALERVVAAHEPTAIVHCGGVSGPMVRSDDPTAVVRINVDGTSLLLDAARRHGVSRFVYCSSIAAYGRTGPGPVGEETPLHPRDVYGATKAAGEQLAEAYRHRFGLSTVSLRLVAVFGPRRGTACSVRDLLLDGAAGRRTRWALPADALQQYVYVDDAAEAVVAALRSEDAVGAFNVSGDDGLSAAEIVEAVRSVEPRVIADLDPPDARAAAEFPGRLDLGAARRELGFVPRHPFVEGVRAYDAWLTADQRA